MDTPSNLNIRLLRVGELARRAGKTNRAIRFYEELDLLSPAQRSKGGFRLYHPESLTRIMWIDRLQELGFSLHDIRQFLQSFRGEAHGPAAMEQLREFYEEKLGETHAAIARLKSLESELQQSLNYLQTCHSCAPSTLRTACHTCNEEHELTEDTPSLVSAVSAPF